MSGLVFAGLLSGCSKDAAQPAVDARSLAYQERSFRLSGATKAEAKCLTHANNRPWRHSDPPTRDEIASLIATQREELAACVGGSTDRLEAIFTKRMNDYLARLPSIDASATTTT